MIEKPQPERAPDEESPPHPAEPLQIDTPVIDMQDLEHDARPATRVSKKGVRVEPTMDSADIRDFAKEDQEAFDAIEKFEKELSRQLPG